MSTTHPSLTQELAEYNDHLDHCLRCKLGMTLATWKTIKATSQLIATVGVLYLAVAPGTLGSETAAFLLTLIIAGPEALEYVIQNSQTQDDK